MKTLTIRVWVSSQLIGATISSLKIDEWTTSLGPKVDDQGLLCIYLGDHDCVVYNSSQWLKFSVVQHD